MNNDASRREEILAGVNINPAKRKRYLDRWAAAGNRETNPVLFAAPKTDSQAFWTCTNRGELLRVEKCQLCGNRNKPAPVFACALHGECTIRTLGIKTAKTCLTCNEAEAAIPTRPAAIAAGITTCPREAPTLGATMEAAAAAGLSPRLFNDPTKSGAWQNWLQAATTLAQAGPSHVLLLQDDVVLSPDAIDVAFRSVWPSDVAARTLYTSSKYHRPRAAADKAHSIPLDDRNLWGACALLFPTPILRRLLETTAVREWDKPANVDTAIGLGVLELGLRIEGFSPSLSQHIGETSTIYPGKTASGKRCAATVRGSLPAPKPRQPAVKPGLPAAAVVVLCHNYGQYLRECVESVLRQNHPAAEVLIVDDASTDQTPAIAAELAGQAVRYLRVEAHNTHAARMAGFAATSAPIVCFLDADDTLPPDYLSEGLPLFADAGIGVVYSDMQQFGERSERMELNEGRWTDIERGNFAHAGSLVRRSALDSTSVPTMTIPCDTSNDWFLWRAIARSGWRFAKSPAQYGYRRHSDSQSYRMRAVREDAYFLNANLAGDDVTLFVPLSGRWEWWPRFAEWLDRQTWPHHQVRLVLCDTSQNDAFHAAVRDWAHHSDYADVRIYRQTVSRPGLADENRRTPEAQIGVRNAMPRIYNRAIRESSTEWFVVIEDDLLPPADAIGRLMRRMDRTVASVSGVYNSRFHNAVIAWDDNQKHLYDGEGVQRVRGNGFGCVLLRRSIVSRHVFHAGAPFHNYDPNFYQWLSELNLAESNGTLPALALLDWTVRCDHAGDTQPKPMDGKAVDQLLADVVAEHGPWTAHRTELTEGRVAGPADFRDAPKLDRILATLDATLGGLSGRRVLDLACLEGMYAIECARRGARAVGVEGRVDNLAKARAAKTALALHDLTLHCGDVRKIDPEQFGQFDAVLCLGLLYHLDASDLLPFARLLRRLTRRALILDTHVSLQATTAAECGPLRIAGEWYKEHPPGLSADEKATRLWTSLDNDWSYWPTIDGLLQLLREAGFPSVHQVLTPDEPGKPAGRVTLLALPA